MPHGSSRSTAEIERLSCLALGGDRSALARLLTEIERGPGGEIVERALAGKGGSARTVGITGPPGAGKSTLLAALLSHVVSSNQRAAALMVDPSSPISGGALLGDRLRMKGLAAERRVFVRSMASRGRSGGLADMTRRAARCLDACGWPNLFIETVGVGQVDVDVATVADAVIVVLHPGTGDEVQISKAGLIEVADLFVVNKADDPRVAELRHDLAAMIATIPAGQPIPPVVETVATTGQGVAELWTAICRHLDRAERSGDLAVRRERRTGQELLEVMRALTARQLEEIAASAEFAASRDDVLAGRESLHSAAVRLLGDRARGHRAGHGRSR